MSGGKPCVSSSIVNVRESVAAGPERYTGGATWPVRTPDSLPSISSPGSLSTTRSSMDNHLHPGLPLRAPGAGSLPGKARRGGYVRVSASVERPAQSYPPTPHYTTFALPTLSLVAPCRHANPEEAKSPCQGPELPVRVFLKWCGCVGRVFAARIA